MDATDADITSFEGDNTAGADIHTAVRDNDVDRVREILEDGNSPNALNRARESPLHVACRRGQGNTAMESRAKLEIVRLLWQYGAKINAKGGSRKETPLAVAVDSLMVDLVDFLLKNGANPNSFDKDQRTPLHIACSVVVPSDDLNVATLSQAIAKFLLLRGANFQARDARSRTPLIEAVCHRNENLVLLLLEFGAQVNYSNRLGMTPLFYACETHNVSMVELLLLHQADVHARENHMRSTPLHLVAGKGRYRDPEDDSSPVARLLLEHGANINAQDVEGQTALHVACDTQDAGLVKTLLELGAKLDVRDDYGNTGLHVLLRNAQEKNGDESRLENIARMLVTRGAGVNDLNNNSETPFLLSVYHGNPRVVSHFLENGANTQSLWYSHKSSLRYLHETPRCNTPSVCNPLDTAEEAASLLNVAAVRGHLEVAEILMDRAGADVEMTNFCGTHDVVKTPLYFAVKNNHLEVAQLFLDASCRINRPVLHGTSVLHVAVSKGNALLTYLLLEYGADSEVKDLHGKTALHYAFEHEHYLLEIIAKVLVKNRVKREFQGLKVNQEDGEIIRSKKWLEEFRQECEMELSRMRKDVVCDNLTLYTIFTKSVDSLAICLGNENVQDALVFNEIKRKFPIYYVTLRYHYQLAFKRKELVDAAIYALNLLFKDLARSLGYGMMPSVVVQKILEFCSLRDLSKIKLIFK